MLYGGGMKLSPGDVIVLDLDEVLALNHSVWCPYFNSKASSHPHSITHVRKEDWTSFDVPGTVCSICFEHILTSPDILLSYQERAGSQHLVETIKNLGLKSVVVTSRPVGTEDITHQWLEEKGILPYLSDVRITQGSKVDVVRDVNGKVIVDDKPSTIQAFQSEPVTAFIFTAPWNRTFDWPNRVGTLSKFERIIRESVV